MKKGLNNKTFISVLFGSFISTMYVFLIYLLFDKLKYSDFFDLMNKLLPSILPLWFICFIFIFVVYKLLNPVFDKWNNKIGFHSKAKYGVPIAFYLVIVIVSVLLGKLLGLGMFNSFIISSSLSVGGIFSASMTDALNSLEKITRGKNNV